MGDISFIIKLGGAAITVKTQRSTLNESALDLTLRALAACYEVHQLIFYGLFLSVSVCLLSVSGI
jgi:isopentenyl phosphate kinase